MERGAQVQRKEPNLLLVAESGAQWAQWVDELDLRNGSLMVLSQPDGERPKEFASRVRARVTDQAFERVVLVCGPKHDQRALALRANMVRAAVGGMAQHGGGEVVLTGPPQSRHIMEGLATTLSDMLLGSRVSVSAFDTTPARAA